MRRFHVTRTAALVFMLTPALALAAPAASSDHRSAPNASCDCAKRAPAPTTGAAPSTTTSPDDLQRIWSAP